MTSFEQKPSVLGKKGGKIFELFYTFPRMIFKGLQWGIYLNLKFVNSP